MLAQLVCVDRRYQRMNTFNARELQALLKQRFFNDITPQFSLRGGLQDLRAQSAYTLAPADPALREATANTILAPVSGAPRAAASALHAPKFDYKAGNYVTPAQGALWPSLAESAALISAGAPRTT